MLTDIRLTDGVDGINAAADMRRRLGTPAIFISARLDADTIRRTRDAGPVGIVNKPFEPAGLLELTGSFFC